jgi:hypothetical protein
MTEKQPRNVSSKKYDVAMREAQTKKPNLNRTFTLLNAALTAGDARAAWALGTWYLHGKHVRRDRTKAVEFLEIAAEGKIPDAIYDLAVCYEKGAGTKKNLRAFEPYVMGALWGDTDSVEEVGRCLYYGIGTTRNRRLSNIWLERAEALEDKGGKTDRGSRLSNTTRSTV